MKETVEVETTTTTWLDEEDIKRLIIEWLDERQGVEWDFDFDFNATGDVVVKVVRKIKKEE